MDNEFGPVDLTGVKPDKLSRLLDMPGVKELIEAAYRAGQEYENSSEYTCTKEFKDKAIYEYMKTLEA